MTRSTRLFRMLAVISVLVVEQVAFASDCFEGISDASARHLYDAMLAASAGSECTLEEVKTELSLVRLTWQKGGWSEPEVLVVPTSCLHGPGTRGKVLSAVVPPEVAAACPVQVAALNALVTDDAFGGLVPVATPVQLPALESRPWVTRHRRLFAASIAVGLGVIAALILLGTRRRQSP